MKEADITKNEAPLVLVCGDVRRYESVFNAIAWTSDQTADFDLVCCLPGCDYSQLMTTLAQEKRLLTTIADLGAGIGERADYTAQATTETELKNAVSATVSQRERVKALKDFSDSSDYYSLAILGLAHTRQVNVEAAWNANMQQMVDYPLLDGVHDSRQLLEDMFEQELLERRFFDRVHHCSSCRSSRLNVREECVTCHSSQLKETSLIHHYPCGFQAIETRFKKGERGLECPKCHKELRHYGVDYDRPTEVYVCADCGAVNSEVEVGFICTDCGDHQNGNAAGRIDWFNYILTSKGIATLEHGILPRSSMRSALEKSIGVTSTREFVQTLGQLSRIGKRYERPLSGMSLKISNLDWLHKEMGVSRVNSVFILLGEVLGQILRETDLLTVKNQVVYLLFPETDPGNMQATENRIRTNLKKVFNVPLEIEFHTWGSDDIEELYQELS